MPIAEIAAHCRSRGVLFHTDCAQSLGKVPVNVQELGVDLLTIAGHKLYAPKGIGALYVRDGVKLEPLIHGAGHESGRRAGTENVPYIVGLGKAAELAAASLPGGDGAIADTSRSIAQCPQAIARRSDRAQRPSRQTPAEHAQRQLRGPHRGGTSGENTGNRCVDRFRVPRRQGIAIAGPVCDGRAAGDRPGGRSADGREVYNRG